MSINYLMTDFDECSLNNPRRACDQMCFNTNGGFSCSCEEGYVLANDRFCEGIVYAYLNIEAGLFSRDTWCPG